MLDPKLLRTQFEEVAEKLKKRGFDIDQKHYLSLENRRKVLQQKTQELQTARNQLSREIGIAKSQEMPTETLMAQVSQIGESLKKNEMELEALQQELTDYLYQLPNVPHDSVPEGKNETDNRAVRKWGTPPAFDFEPKDHVALGEGVGLMDFESAAHLSGSRFVVLYDGLSRLQRALSQFMLDLHIHKHHYREVYVPYLVREDCLYGTGQLPKFREDQFSVDHQNLYLIPTSEVALANLTRDKILDPDELPAKWVAHTPCFRKEAGSYGKDTRGMIRQHQFEKVELVQIVTPESSYETLENLTQHAEEVLRLLNLPYRVVELCTGDIGFAAAKTYDLEVWLPGQNQYREISSCSNCEAFQARRMRARYRSKKTDKPEFVHTLNGSGVAVGRALVAVMENYQDKDGGIRIPDVLLPYMQGVSYIPPMINP